MPLGSEVESAREFERVAGFDAQSFGGVREMTIRPDLIGFGDLGGDDAMACGVAERVRDQEGISPKLVELGIGKIWSVSTPDRPPHLAIRTLASSR